MFEKVKTSIDKIGWMPHYIFSSLIVVDIYIISMAIRLDSETVPTHLKIFILGGLILSGICLIVLWLMIIFNTDDHQDSRRIVTDYDTLKDISYRATKSSIKFVRSLAYPRYLDDETVRSIKENLDECFDIINGPNIGPKELTFLKNKLRAVRISFESEKTCLTNSFFQKAIDGILADLQSETSVEALEHLIGMTENHLDYLDSKAKS